MGITEIIDDHARKPPEGVVIETMYGLDSIVTWHEDWHDEAVCREVDDPDLFFPERGRSSSVAKALCADCPVLDRCLAFALENADVAGVWGGTTPVERRQMKRRDRRRGRRALLSSSLGAPPTTAGHRGRRR